MQKFKKFLLPIVILLFTNAHSAEKPSNIQSFKSSEFEFKYPSTFEVGTYYEESPTKHLSPDMLAKLPKDVLTDMENTWKDYTVLVEKNTFQNLKEKDSKITLQTLPPSTPGISIKIHKGPGAEIYSKGYREETKSQRKLDIKTKKIGNHNVDVWPGFPGKFGNETYFYTITLAPDKVVSFMGNKLKGKYPNLRAPTEYDQIIEKIIETLVIK